ncbi:putative leucine-rich repeat receptor-like protein kinase [Vitis vinifera]|uniref:Putative leucine-rich repeat receptor-like protein kinase n=1 Tax=Vitis vinifera TaxID=29760 RepID=A0A438IRH9_VITVI|nr:putative leucine-rich repeat receptor-like protein kinase [Vitis vinifera]
MASWKTTLLLLTLFLLSLFLELLLAQATIINSIDGGMNKGCIEVERKALLEFKNGLKDPSGRLSSWVGADCCKWKGVDCNNQTGHVVKVDLKSGGDFSRLGGGFSRLGGEISSSLLDLKHLTYLDLSLNDFQGIPIPNFLGSFERLRYLNLSNARFGGMIPPHLGNLSQLRYLDLLGGDYPMRVSNLNWLSGLSSLKYLDLAYVDLSKATTNWMQAVNMLPFLLELHLSGCHLSHFPQYSNPFVNLTSVSLIDLSNNNFNTTLPGWLFNISTLMDLYLNGATIKGPIPRVNLGSLRNLVTLDLSFNYIGSEAIELVNGLSTYTNNSLEWLNLGYNQFGGQLPDSLGLFKNLKYLNLMNNSFVGPFPNSIQHLTNLEILYLIENFISGPIPTWIGNLLRMKRLHLSNNLMNGTIPESIGQLRELTELYLDWNSWEGVISEIHFSNLTKLTEFSLLVSPKNQSLRFHLRPEWIPPFSLESIEVYNCHVSLKFPNWLRTQKRLGFMILKNVGISDAIPEWLWKQDFSWLDLSRNQLYGTLPNSSSFSQDALVDLSFNHLGGPLPLRLNVGSLYLGNNSFSGPIPLNIGELSSLEILDVSCNLLNGSIPSSISKLKYLGVINLSNNHLSGKIPKNWNDLPWLDTVDLSKNKMSGGIPSWMCSKSSLTQLILGDNNLSGEPFPSLRNCTGLYSLDLGNNRFSGERPKWIGERMPSLEQLRLRGNMLTGDIPEKLCWLSHLHILDLAVNNLSGSIPQCLGNLTALSFVTLLDRNFDDPNGHVVYSERMELVVKGQNMEFDSILPIVNLIDLSSNNIWGEIPKEITNLSTLGTLNLSRNQLTGKIPEKIGAMQGLETLDLSCNCLSGPIPPSMSSITSLNHLNLSHNRLSGPIPKTNQFSTFNDPSIYEANLGLCGPPLSTNCSTLNDQDHKDEEEDEDEWDMSWFFISMGLGFPVGFWVVYGSLVLKKSWRQAYFRFIDETRDRLYVFTAVNVARLKRKMEANGVHG